ncbi:hypothetical protein GGF42_002798, partial [Coemansia sp. RSA 2424]
LVMKDMVGLLLTIIIKAPEIITDANTLPAETSAEAIRDFFVEKIIYSCAHPTSAEALCGHQYNRTLVGVETETGVTLSLKSSAYVDPREEKATLAPSFDSTDMGARDGFIESIKQLGEVLYIGALLHFDEDDRSRYTGAPESGFEHTHVDSCVLEDFSSDRVFFFSHGNSILKIYNEPETPSAEAQACDDADSYDSASDSCAEDSVKSAAPIESSVDPSRLRVFSNGLRNEDTLSPLKMDLFRNLVQHKLVFSARKTTINYYVPLVKSESLFRDIRALDRIHARETVKIAVLYVGPGQWSEAEILSNSLHDTSRSYRSFVDSLGWQVDLATFQGFTGKLEIDGSDGESCPYYADESIEVAFHEAAAMPKDQKDMRQIKKVG